MNKKSKYCLHEAVKKRDLKKAKELLEKGANPNAYDDLGETPLIYACLDGNTEMVKLLLEYKAKPNQYENNITCRNALHCAIYSKKVEIVKLLLDNGANPNKVEEGRDGFYTPIELAIMYDKSEDIFNLLLNKGAKLKGTEILLASQNGRYEIVKKLLEKGQNPNKMDDLHRTPLHLSIKGGSVKLVELLIRKGSKSRNKRQGRINSLASRSSRKEALNGRSSYKE